MTDTPCSLRRPIRPNSSDSSRSVRMAEGSSMMMRRDRTDKALAISTICCWARLRLLTGRRPLMACPKLASNSSERRSIASRSSHPRGPRASSCPRKMFSATVIPWSRFSSWWIMVIPRFLATMGESTWWNRPPNRILPASGW